MSRKFLIPTLLVFALFGVAIPWIVIADNRTPASGGGGTAAATPSTGGGTTAPGQKKVAAGGAAGGGLAAQGKTIFTQACGSCHTLADAGTAGKVGPVLDQIKPDKARVLKALKIGGTGSGTMPANLVTGKDAQAVATYVSSVAGK
jgi:mono/diheme cytochrome c family protein